MKKFKITTVAIICLGMMGTQSFAHSGRTDSSGCHGGSRPYHCHNSKPSTSSSTYRSENKAYTKCYNRGGGVKCAEILLDKTGNKTNRLNGVK